MTKRRLYYGEVRALQTCWTVESANAALLENWILLHIGSQTQLRLEGSVPVYDTRVVFVLGLLDQGGKETE